MRVGLTMLKERGQQGRTAGGSYSAGGAGCVGTRARPSWTSPWHGSPGPGGEGREQLGGSGGWEGGDDWGRTEALQLAMQRGHFPTRGGTDFSRRLSAGPAGWAHLGWARWAGHGAPAPPLK